MVESAGFRVHLQSLKDFEQRLKDQLEVVQRYTGAAEVLNRPPDLPLGAFAEAFSLSDYHSDAVRQSQVLLEKVARSIDFTRSVTRLVAERYEALDAASVQRLAAVRGAPLVVWPRQTSWPASASRCRRTAAPSTTTTGPPPCRLV
jgi:hypothetical protein